MMSHPRASSEPMSYKTQETAKAAHKPEIYEMACGGPGNGFAMPVAIIRETKEKRP